jgi:hypothetical protein
MDMEQRYRALLDDIRAELPGFRVVKKDESLFQRAIGAALAVLTLGAQRRYMTSYQTTIGKTVYVTSDWDRLPPEQRYITMRHERVHLRQFQRFTLPGMAILYLLVPFPVGVAWFRARFEKEGYEETVRAAAEIHGLPYVKRAAFRDYVIAQFVSGAYGWMWPFRRALDRWYDGVLAGVEREMTSN